MTPPSVSTSSVTIGRVPLGFSAAPASGSSAGSATTCERMPDIFIGAPWVGWSAQAHNCTACTARKARSQRRPRRNPPRVLGRSAYRSGESRRQWSALSDHGAGRVARAAHRSRWYRQRGSRARSLGLIVELFVPFEFPHQLQQALLLPSRDELLERLGDRHLCNPLHTLLHFLEARSQLI